MTTSLTAYIPALKREVAAPGEYDANFPSSDDGELLGGLADGFGQAQLDGFFGSQTLDLSGTTPTYIVTPDLSLAGGQLCVIYAGERILRSKLRGMQTKTLYKAGSVEYETNVSASAISEELKSIAARKATLLLQVLRQGRASNAVHITDGYLIRSQGYFGFGSWGDFGGFYGYELSALGSLGGF